MKIVSKLEAVNSRIKVYINGEVAFVLYKGEIRKFNISEGQEIGEEAFGELMSLLYNRAKERALYLLDKSYKTEKEIYDKLKSGFYPELIVQKVIGLFKEHDLINDLRYSVMYIDYKKNTKSKKQIIQELYRKGISKEIISTAFKENDFSERDSLDKLVEKRISKYDINDYKSINKLYQYLISKGYNYSDVKAAISRYTTTIDFN